MKMCPLIFLVLKLVSTNLSSFFIFSSNVSPRKSVENAFYFIEKAFSVLKEIQIFVIFPFLFTLKRTNVSGIIYDVMNWLE